MILCSGEALMDALPDGAGGWRYVPGGGAFNTARALGRLGVETGYFGPLSTDAHGRALRGALAESGVATGLCPSSDRPTAVARVRVSPAGPSYVFEDTGTAGRMLEAADLPGLPGHVRALVLGGISLAAEPCGTAYETLAGRAGPGRLVMLDPNIRPAAIVDMPAFQARLGRLLARADIVKLSAEDLAWLHPDGAPAEALLAAGPALVVLTEGAAGARTWTRSGLAAACAAAPAEVVDTVGAGDTFNAGLLTALDRRGKLSRAALDRLGASDLVAMLDLAARAAAVTVGRPGADPPWPGELPTHP